MKQHRQVAWVIVLAVSELHYRMVNIGILSNNVLAAYKVGFLGILTAAGFFATCRDGARHRLSGLQGYINSGSEARAFERNIPAIL